MWRDLAPIGRSARSGGYFRQPFTAAERECRAWFLAACAARDLEVVTDPLGNTVAWWRPEHAEGTGVLTGSHLDSVLDGGAFDGPLGVVSALAAIDLMRERGLAPVRPLGVVVFVEEEGSRFGTPCLGSRIATGSLDPAAAAELRDPEGTRLGDVAEVGPSDLLADVGVFVELHVEQGRALEELEEPVGVATGIWPHGRHRFDFHGVADHAGTTRMDDRHDPMLTYAMTALAANKQARLAGARATFGRVEVAPNATNAIPSRVTGWLDARAADEQALAELLAVVRRMGEERAARDGTRLEVIAESHSPAVAFDPELARRLATGHVRGDWPLLATQAGHDAGILATAGIPTAMLFVRNPTGVSHAPAEFARTDDCLRGVEALAETLRRLAVQP